MITNDAFIRPLNVGVEKCHEFQFFILNVLKFDGNTSVLFLITRNWKIRFVNRDRFLM